MFAPPPISHSNKCERCGLRYPESEMECTHCKNLTDPEVDELISKSKNELKGNENLGRLLLYITALIIAGMVIAII